jgi:hypothetical protein
LDWISEIGSRPRSAPVVYIFEVSRVYKGAVSQRQEIVTPAHTGPEALVFIAPLGGPLRPHTWVKGFFKPAVRAAPDCPRRCACTT